MTHKPLVFLRWDSGGEGVTLGTPRIVTVRSNPTLTLEPSTASVEDVSSPGAKNRRGGYAQS
ncbi:MAG TPA: hypothetical protein VFW70_18820, partial [Methylomirabilota bacterium]|nr:hypothetical protein [Methylomirabilota bacterium]